MPQVIAFGERLRSWRARRGLSQMELGLEAEVSARHLSFMETGRARPSREMVLRLAAALDLPLRERNALLLGAGFAPRYAERPLDDAELREALAALRFILEAHEPYPAFVLDREWRIVLWNRPQEILLRELLGRHTHPGDLNALDLVFEAGLLRERILNWPEVAAAVLRRLERQLSRVAAGDPLEERWNRIRKAPGVERLVLSDPADAPVPILVPMQIRFGRRVLSWFSTLAVFGASGEITLEELVIESFFPADDRTRSFVEEAAGKGRSRRRLRRR